MKKIITLFAFFAAMTFLVTSCRDDNDNHDDPTGIPELNGFIQVDGGTKFTVTQAIVQGFKYADPSETNTYQIVLQHVDEGQNHKNVSLALEFPASSSSIDGTYNISGTTRVLDSWMTSYSEGTGTNMQSYNNLSAGICTISRSGNNFNITFNYTVAGGKVISGEFNDAANVQEATM